MIRPKAVTLSVALVIGMAGAAQAASVTSTDIFSLPGTAPGSLGHQVSGSIQYDQGTNLLDIELTNNATDPDNHIVGFVFNIAGDAAISESSFPSQPDSGPWGIVSNPTQNAPYGSFDWGVTLEHVSPVATVNGLNGIPQPERGVEHGDTGFWQFLIEGPDAANLVARDFLDEQISSGNGSSGFDTGFAVRLQGAEITDKIGITVPSPAAAGAGLMLLGGLLMRRPATQREAN